MINNNAYEKFTDDQLIRKLQKKNDLTALNTLYNRYTHRLYRFAFRITKDSLSAEDVVQETMIRVYYKRDKYRQIARFSTWIYTIAGNLARTELRRIKRRSIISIDDDQHRYQKDVGVIPDDTEIPDDILQRKMALHIVKWKIEKLKPKFRDAVTLRDLEHFSYEEISQILKIPIGTVKSRVNRARGRLKDNLGYLRK